MCSVDKACLSARNVQPGKSTLTKITPAGPGGAPEPAEMARELEA